MTRDGGIGSKWFAPDCSTSGHLVKAVHGRMKLGLPLFGHAIILMRVR
jgi:hypothetical protein